MTTKFVPENWLETTIRGIQTYVEEALDGTPENEAYQVVMEFPGPSLDNSDVPLTKTIVHFEIDDIQNRLVGFGDNVFAINYDEATKTTNPQEARVHEINFDFGIWASARTGGITARARFYQYLLNLFGGAMAFRKFNEATDGGDGGIQILRFSGGRFINDTINDQPVYRTVNGELVVRVYSRTPLAAPEDAIASIEDVQQDQNFTIPA